MFYFHQYLILSIIFNSLFFTPDYLVDKDSNIIITKLKCEYLSTPNNIDAIKPRFSWVLESDERGQSQSAYQVFVSSGETKLDNMWNSGKILSSETSLIYYQGEELSSSTKYYWSVYIWDKHGRKSESKQTHFWTSILDSTNWKPKWIGASLQKEYFPPQGFFTSHKDQYKLTDTVDHEGRSLLLRNEFQCNGKISSARVYVTGLGFYEIYLNGAKVGNHLLAPAKTNYREEILYDTYDVTDMIRKGDNALGIHLGNGWFNPYKKWWRPYRMQWFGAKRAYLQLEIEYINGKSELIITDEDWKTSLGPITFNCIYDGEVYDANEEQPDWTKTGFDDSNWENAVKMEAPGGVLKSHTMPPVIVTQKMKPVKIYEPSPDTLVYDFGQNFAGTVQITVKGVKGTKLKLHFAEDIDSCGSLDPTSNEHAKAKAIYILKGGNSETYQPKFTYFGFKYVQITYEGEKPLIENIEGLVLHTAIENTGYFDSSNETINKIHDATVWSQRSNIIGYPMDCPQRDERLGWFGDVQVTIEEAMFNFDTPQFYRNWLSGIKLNQDKITGDIPIISPRPYIWDEGVEWSSTYLILVWKYFTYFGDKQILTDHYPVMKSYMEFLSSISNDYIIKKGWIGDWGSLVEGWKEGEPESVPTAFYYWNAKILSDISKILGYEHDESYYSSLSSKIKDSYNNKFYNSKEKNYTDGSQMANAFPLFLELVPESDKKYVLENLVDDIVNENNGHLTTGVLGSKYMIDALTKNGKEDIAFLLATQTGYPSWSDMVEKYTTMCEFWTLKQSHNHVMTGSIDAFFYKTLAGLNIIEKSPATKIFAIKPYIPNDLEYVKASIETINGKLSSSWTKIDKGVNYKFSIPVNFSAEIIIPNVDWSKIYESGLRVKDNKDVELMRLDSLHSKLLIRSGDYDFFIAN